MSSQGFERVAYPEGQQGQGTLAGKRTETTATEGIAVIMKIEAKASPGRGKQQEQQENFTLQIAKQGEHLMLEN